MARNRAEYREKQRAPKPVETTDSREAVSKRKFLTFLVGASGVGIVTAVFGPLALRAINDEDSHGNKYFEESYQYYESALASIATKSQSARSDLDWLRTNGIRATISEKNGQTYVFPKEVPDPHRQIIVAVLDRNQTPRDYKSFTGFAGVGDWQDTYPLLLLRNERVTSIWAGAVLAHEIKHAQKRVKQNIPPIELNIRVQGEIEAYSHEFVVLDEYTGGKFGTTVKEIADHYSGHTTGPLTNDEMSKFNDMFGDSLSDTEKSMRNSNITLAVNFAISDRLKSTDLERYNDKFVYMSNLYTAPPKK